jgi:hypothetical protein
MTGPEQSDYHSETFAVEGRILEVANFVINNINEEFDSLPPEEIEDYNLRLILNGDTAVLQSGKLRTIEIESERQTLIYLQDTHLSCVDVGEPVDLHVISLFVVNPEQKYSLTLELAHGGVAIGMGDMSEDVSAERYPELCEQMLGSLSLVADSLIIAA